jgi:hypothetical protein
MRDYAQIFTAIWSKEDDFAKLPASQQRVFLMLCSQKDLSACGVLHLRIKFWASLSPDTLPEDIESDLRGLESGRFLVIDWDDEELLIRSFIRWDKGYANKLRRIAIRAAFEQVSSAEIRRCLTEEFGRVGMPPPPPPSGTGQMEFAQVDSPSDAASDTPSNTPSEGTSDGQSQIFDAARDPWNLEPRTENQREEPARKRACRLPEDWVPDQDLLNWGKINAPGVDLGFETDKFRDYWLAKSGRDATKTDWRRTWRNWIRGELGRTPARQRLRAVAGVHQDPQTGIRFER